MGARGRRKRGRGAHGKQDPPAGCSTGHALPQREFHLRRPTPLAAVLGTARLRAAGCRRAAAAGGRGRRGAAAGGAPPPPPATAPCEGPGAPVRGALPGGQPWARGSPGGGGGRAQTKLPEGALAGKDLQGIMSAYFSKLEETRLPRDDKGDAQCNFGIWG